MPLYEYYCADCRTKFDALRPMSQADAPIQCKECEGMRTSRALSLFAAHRPSPGNVSQSSAPLTGGGGCCGGMCGCAH